MSKNVDFYYDFGSPTAYLAWTQLPAMCARHGASITYKPILLGGLFKAIGSNTPVALKPKAEWMMADIPRFAERYGVPFAMNPYFIINTLTIMRGAVWAQSAGVIEPYNKAMFEAVWANERNMAEIDEIVAVTTEAGLDAAAMGEAVQQPDIKQGLIANTEEAAERGVFGAPTMFVADEMHFGQDRLDWVEQALSRT
ncbi:MAG: 2-hydroxychromene-2-carboxylate isomerase [Hyphomicrobiales bacterium]